MAMTRPYNVPSLIGGVSAQSPQERHPSMCEDQKNCVNDPLYGVKPRPGGVVLGSVALLETQTTPFTFRIDRDEDELYQLIIEGGKLRIYNMLSGVRATLTDNCPSGHLEDYLTHTGEAYKAFDAVTVEDTTFILNRQVTAQMDDAKTAKRDNKAIFYFKAASYKTTYRCRIKKGGTWYQAAYTTPDNSDPGNAKYIATNRLATELRAALDSLKADVAPALNGFTFSRYGSCVVVEGPDGTDFDVDSEDGAGDTQMVAMTEWVNAFSDLPQRAPANFKIGVRGEKSERKDDYWLKYSADANTTGSWEEIVKPDTKYRLDELTMPLVLVNTAKDSFTIDVGSWGDRVCGDGVRTAKNPQFIGKRIRSMAMVSGRLCLMTGDGVHMSRSRNAYSFFPDSAQVRLATDPIGFDTANGASTLMQHLTVGAKKVQMWGNRFQAVVDSGDQAMTEETVDTTPVMEYEFDGVLKPIPVGMNSVFFSTKRQSGNLFKEIILDDGVPRGEVGINEHCPHFISGKLKSYAASTASGCLAALSESTPSLFLYQWRNSGSDRVQSAWNRWDFEGIDDVVAAAFREGDLFLIIRQNSKLLFERFHLGPKNNEYGWIRLDHRVTEEGASWSGKTATLDLPYSVDTDDRANWVAIENEEPANGRYLGRKLDVEWVDGNTIRVAAKLASGSKFWFGRQITATTTFGRLQVRSQGQTPVLPRNLLIEKVVVSVEETTSFGVILTNRRGETIRRENWEARKAFTDAPVTEMAPSSGEAEFHVGFENKEVNVTLVNDSPYPSRWVMMDWYYGETVR